MSATKGLEGIVATTSSISSIVDGVLTYRGIDIDDLAENATFEEVIYLLWFGKLPNQAELEKLQSDLNAYSKVPDAVIEQLKHSRKMLIPWLLFVQQFLHLLCMMKKQTI